MIDSRNPGVHNASRVDDTSMRPAAVRGGKKRPTDDRAARGGSLVLGALEPRRAGHGILGYVSAPALGRNKGSERT